MCNREIMQKKKGSKQVSASWTRSKIWYSAFSKMWLWIEWAGLTCFVSTKSKLQIANVSLIWTAFYKPQSDSTYCRLTVVDIVQCIETYTQFSEGKLFNSLFPPLFRYHFAGIRKGKIALLYMFLFLFPLLYACGDYMQSIQHEYFSYIYISNINITWYNEQLLIKQCLAGKYVHYLFKV